MSAYREWWDDPPESPQTEESPEPYDFDTMGRFEFVFIVFVTSLFLLAVFGLAMEVGPTP